MTLVTSISGASRAASSARRPRARAAASSSPPPVDRRDAARSAALPTMIDASCSSTRSRICWTSSRIAAARSNSSSLAADRISASIRVTRASTLTRSASLKHAASLGAVDHGRLRDRAEALVEVVDALDDRRRLDPVLEVVGGLDRPAAVRLVDRDLHRLGHPVGVHDDLAADVPRRPADHLDQRPGRPQEALLVGVEDRDEGHLRQVDPLPEQVDPDEDVEDAEAQVAQDRDALERVDLAVQVLDLDAELLEVVGEVLGHLLGQRRDEGPLTPVDADPDLLEEVVDLAVGRADRDRRVDDAGRADELLDDRLAPFQLVRTRASRSCRRPG